MAQKEPHFRLYGSRTGVHPSGLSHSARLASYRSHPEIRTGKTQILCGTRLLPSRMTGPIPLGLLKDDREKVLLLADLGLMEVYPERENTPLSSEDLYRLLQVERVTQTEQAVESAPPQQQEPPPVVVVEQEEQQTPQEEVKVEQAPSEEVTPEYSPEPESTLVEEPVKEEPPVVEKTEETHDPELPKASEEAPQEPGEDETTPPSNAPQVETTEAPDTAGDVPVTPDPPKEEPKEEQKEEVIIDPVPENTLTVAPVQGTTKKGKKHRKNKEAVDGTQAVEPVGFQAVTDQTGSEPTTVSGVRGGDNRPGEE